MEMTRNRLLIAIGALTSLLPTVVLFQALNVLFFVPLLVGLGCVVAGFAKVPPAAKARATIIGSVACLAAAIGPMIFFAYANRTGYPVKIVLPVGFHGEFSIVKNQAIGQDVELQDGVWVYELPPSGELLIKDGTPFHRWHSETYCDANGKPVAVESLGVTAGSEVTGPNSSMGSTAYDGTTYRWQTVDAR